jgi:hypothetical protein
VRPPTRLARLPLLLLRLWLRLLLPALPWLLLLPPAPSPLVIDPLGEVKEPLTEEERAEEESVEAEGELSQPHTTRWYLECRVCVVYGVHGV